MAGDGQMPLVGAPYLWWKRILGRVPGGAVAVAGLDRVEGTLGRVPVLVWAWRRVAEVEDGALSALRDRLTQLDGALPISAVMPVRPVAEGGPATNGHRVPAEAFASLLHQGEGQSPTAARGAAVLRTIEKLVPDEARILISMAGGTEPAVLQAHDGGDQIVRNQSNAGRAAKVHAQDLTPIYVTHLLDLGLVELVPYQGRKLYEWELIEAETAVRDVLGRYDHRKLAKPKITRQLLRLSPEGRAFCDACIPLS